MITLSNAMTIPVSLINNNFVHNYCKACHSFQGSTIEEAITIFDHKFAHFTRKVALQCRHQGYGPQKKVFFYEYDESKENEREMIQYFTRKVENTGSKTGRRTVPSTTQAS